YPHLPPELTRPLPQLFAVLIAHDYAPHNAGAFAGSYGTRSMLPLLLCALAAFALCLSSIGNARTRAITASMSVMLGCALLLPNFHHPNDEPGVPQAVAFITRHFSPEGHDAAAKLKQHLLATLPLREAELQALAALYDEEGRTHEAA